MIFLCVHAFVDFTSNCGKHNKKDKSQFEFFGGPEKGRLGRLVIGERNLSLGGLLRFLGQKNMQPAKWSTHKRKNEKFVLVVMENTKNFDHTFTC